MSVAKWNTPSAWSADIAGSGAGTLNSNPGLATGVASSVLADIANDTNLDINIQLQLEIASMTGAGSPSCTLYLVPKINGVYQRFSASVLSGEVATVAVPTGTQTYPMQFDMRLLPGTYGIIVINNMGNALPTSGNVLKYRTYNEQVV